MRGRREGSIHGRWMLGAFLATLIALVWFFQRPDAWRAAVLDADGGATSEAYLRAMIAADPTDVALRLKLAQERVKAEDWDGAQAALTPVLDVAGGRRPEVWLQRLRIWRMELHRLDAADGRREALKERLLDELEGLIETEDATPYLEELAAVALELEQPRLAAKAYEKLARRAPESRATDWLREAGRWYLAAGAPMRAAGVFHAAVVRGAPETVALEALAALRAGDAGAQALEVSARYLERFPTSRPLLEAAIANARAESAAREAFAWGQRRLALDPDDPLWLDQVCQLALDVGDLEAALRLTHRRLEQDPTNPEVRTQLAETAEWAGQLAVALPNWVWLATRDPAGPGLARGLSLARALGNDQALIRLLQLASAQRALEPVEFDELAQACQRAPALGEGIALLTAYLRQHGDQTAAWKALAALRESDGDVPGAVEAWRKVAEDVSERLPASLRASDLLWRSGQREAAWEVLTAVRADAGDAHDDYWLRLADQAWESKRVSEAEGAYRRLWTAGSSQPLVAERLVLLASQTAPAEETIALAKAAFQRVGEPRVLLLGMEAALNAERPRDLRGLLDIADQARARFPSLASYWLRLGSIEQRQGRAGQAREAYEKVLELDPNSEDARVALLWLAINEGDATWLQTLLARWEADARSAPALWQPYAVGLSRLGEEARALPWFQRRARNAPQDSDAMLDYADALAKTGREEEARELRKAAYQIVRKKLSKPPG